MAVREDLDAFVEQIVDAAQIPSRRHREQLRRELRSHFEESGLAPEALQEAFARFGNTARIGDSFRRVYRHEFWLFYLVRLAASIAVATVAAIVIEAIANVRVGAETDAWHFTAGFGHAAAFGVVLTLAFIAAAEATRAPFSALRALLSIGCYAIVSACALSIDGNSMRALVTAFILAIVGVGLARAATAWTSRTLLTLAACVVAEYLLHQSLGVTLSPMRTLAASMTLLTLWASTITIVAFSERAFVTAFKTT